jgi:hypothetical protein
MLLQYSRFYIHNVKIYNSSYKYNNVDIMAAIMLTYSCLKFIDKPLFTMCAFTCIQTSNIDLFDP